MDNANDNRIKYQTVLDEFLKMREWTDEYEIDPEKKSVSLNTQISIGEGQSGRLIIEASDETDLVNVYIYYNFTCKAAKLSELAVLLNGIHQRWPYGRFMVLADGYIRWTHRVDFEGTQPTGLAIDRIVGPAWSAVETFADTIAAVALTKQSAADAIQEYDDEQSIKNA